MDEPHTDPVGHSKAGAASQLLISMAGGDVLLALTKTRNWGEIWGLGF